MFGFLGKKEEKAKKLRLQLASDIERICSETAVWELSLLKKNFSGLEKCLSGFESNLENRFLNLNDRLSSLEDRFLGLDDRLSKQEEQSQLFLRQERRRQTALESLFENQQKILEVLERPQMSPPLEALMALAENFALIYPENSQTLASATPVSAARASAVLRGKLFDLMGCFDLSLVAEIGVDFDPEKHEACGVDFDPAYPENAVLEVVTPGFLLKGKPLRCAMVVVNRRPAEDLGAPGEPYKQRVVSEEEYYA